MKRPTVKLDDATLRRYLYDGISWIFDDIKSGIVRQDHLTARDLQSYVRFRVDLAANQTKERPAAWWGYNGWCRVVAPGIENLQGHVRSFLFEQVNEGKLEAHNFGRGHCSGARFRLAGTGLSEAEKKTIARKEKPKLVHLSADGYALCSAAHRRQSTRRLYARRRRSSTLTTRDASKVTCPRCLKKMEAQPCS